MNDGDIVEMQGSGKNPYELKRIGDTYSCSCPAWRNQSQPINKRTCKHLRKLLGDDHESTRIGGSLIASRPTKGKVTAVAPALMLAEKWDGSDPTGMIMSEKLDGVRAYWDGTKFLSRRGNEFYPPAWYTAKFQGKLDGELWMGRGLFQDTVSIVRTQGLDVEWKKITYRVYDCMMAEKVTKVEDRIRRYTELVKAIGEPWVQAVDQIVCTGPDHLAKMLADVERLKGEGIMLRVPGSVYEGKRSSNLLKVKSFLDAEAIVTGYGAGEGNRTGMVGALIVEGCSDGFEGKKFSIGTGLTHKVLKNPPTIGTKITFAYAKGALSDDGLPKPAVYKGEAIDK